MVYFLNENVIVSSLIHSNEPGKIFDIFAKHITLAVLIIGHHFGIKRVFIHISDDNCLYFYLSILPLLDPNITVHLVQFYMSLS